MGVTERQKRSGDPAAHSITVLQLCTELSDDEGTAPVTWMGWKVLDLDPVGA